MDAATRGAPPPAAVHLTRPKTCTIIHLLKWSPQAIPAESGARLAALPPSLTPQMLSLFMSLLCLLLFLTVSPPPLAGWGYWEQSRPPSPLLTAPSSEAVCLVSGEWPLTLPQVPAPSAAAGRY